MSAPSLTLAGFNQVVQENTKLKAKLGEMEDELDRAHETNQKLIKQRLDLEQRVKGLEQECEERIEHTEKLAQRIRRLDGPEPSALKSQLEDVHHKYLLTEGTVEGMRIALNAILQRLPPL